MERNKLKGAKVLELKRVFQESRVASELMGSAYERVVPIEERSVEPTSPAGPARRFWASVGTEEQSCAVRA